MGVQHFLDSDRLLEFKGVPRGALVGKVIEALFYPNFDKNITYRCQLGDEAWQAPRVIID